MTVEARLKQIEDRFALQDVLTVFCNTWSKGK